MTLPELAATDMLLRIRWCAEGRNILKHTLTVLLYIERRQTSRLVNLQGFFLRPQLTDELEMEAYVLRYSG